MLRPSQQHTSVYRNQSEQSEHSLGDAEFGVTQNPSNHDQRMLVSERLNSVGSIRKESLYAPLLSIGRNGLVPTKAARSPGALRLHPASCNGSRCFERPCACSFQSSIDGGYRTWRYQYRGAAPHSDAERIAEKVLAIPCSGSFGY